MTSSGNIDRGACTVAVVVPPQFAETLHSSGQASVQALLDASDSNTANIGMGYALSIVQAYSQRVQIEWQQRHGLPPVAPQTSPSSRAPGSTKTWKAWRTLCPAWWPW